MFKGQASPTVRSQNITRVANIIIYIPCSSGAINTAFLENLAASSSAQILDGELNISVISATLDGTYIETGANFQDLDEEVPQEVIERLSAEVKKFKIR